MTLAPRVTAVHASVEDALELLDSDFRPLADGLSDGEYGLWLGSGISLNRVDGLRKVVSRVIEFLRGGARDDWTSPHGVTLTKALRKAGLETPTIESLDIATPFELWPCAASVVTSLVGQYSILLDQTVAGETPDYLLWNAVEIGTTFPESAQPDVEHLCIAALALEGTFQQIASANWDGLLEAAAQALAPGQHLLKPCVLKTDLQAGNSVSQLYKFHGCAVMAIKDEPTYRKLLVGRQSQITDWPNNPDYQLMQMKLVDMAVNRPTLMIGLSAQDTDIQDIFSKAGRANAWIWDPDHPKGVFAEDALSSGQENILKVAYSDEVYTANEPEILRLSTFPAYGKALLVGLLLTTIERKLGTLVQLGFNGRLSPLDRDLLLEGVRQIRDRFAHNVGSPDWTGTLEEFFRIQSSALAILTTGKAHPHAGGYFPVSRSSVSHLAQDPVMATAGSPEFAIILAIVGMGVTSGRWGATAAPAGDPLSTLLISIGARTYRLLVTANDRAATQLIVAGAIDDNDDNIVLAHCTTTARARRRSPRRVYGRTGATGLREIHLPDLVSNSSSAAELVSTFAVLGGLA